MDKSKKYWEEEEFEDLIARSLISLYEEKINKKWLNVPNCIKPTQEEFLRIKKLGTYYCPDDREILPVMQIDLINDGLPNRAILSTTKNKDNHYFTTLYMEKVKSLPGRYIKKPGTIYNFIAYEAMNNEPVRLSKCFIIVDKSGTVHDAWVRCPKGETNFGFWPIDPNVPNQADNRTSILAALYTLNLFQDRRYLWNVRADEGIAKATFGVYPEQIKSLFYSRSLPQTETGRKRPILHWVAAHRRRIKAGIDIDIEKHLRGINEFEWHGTKFIITHPIKSQ